MTVVPGYRADVQGLRAIAVLLVLLFHFDTGIQGGYLGVDMFFVISGYVIAASTLREIDRTNAFSWNTFLRRRVRRLLPGMVLVMVATAIASLLLLSPFGPQQETAKMLLSAATYTSNFVLMPQGYFSLDSKANPLLHLWSLAVEEQFYFVWPIVILALVNIRSRLNEKALSFFIWSMSCLLIIGSVWLFVELSHNGARVREGWWFNFFTERNISPEFFAFYSPLTRAWEFVAGVLVALLLQKRVMSHTDPSGVVRSGFGIALVVLGVTWASQNSKIEHGMSLSTNTSATIAVVVGTSLWILGGNQRNWLSILLSVRPLTWMGNCSYSIYLLHWPIWVFLVSIFDQSRWLIVVAFLLSVGMGWLQFRFVEEPIRLGEKVIRLKTAHHIALFSTVLLVLSMVMSNLIPKIAEHLAGRKPDEIELHVSERPCVEEPFIYQSTRSCVFGPKRNNGVAILVGDSMAKSLSNGFVEATASNGLKSYVFSSPGCPFLVPDSIFVANNECKAWRNDVFNVLKILSPRVVVVANLSSIYAEVKLADWSVDETKLLWGSQLALTLDGLSGLNTQVIIAQPPPKFAFDLRYDLSLLWSNSVKEPRNNVVSRRKDINQIEGNAIVGFRHVRPTINFTDLFCDSQLCDPRVEGIFMFEDSDHLSVAGSIFVAEQLRIAITETMLVYASSLSK